MYNRKAWLKLLLFWMAETQSHNTMEEGWLMAHGSWLMAGLPWIIQAGNHAGGYFGKGDITNENKERKTWNWSRIITTIWQYNVYKLLAWKIKRHGLAKPGIILKK